MPDLLIGLKNSRKKKPDTPDASALPASVKFTLGRLPRSKQHILVSARPSVVRTVTNGLVHSNGLVAGAAGTRVSVVIQKASRGFLFSGQWHQRMNYAESPLLKHLAMTIHTTLFAFPQAS